MVRENVEFSNVRPTTVRESRRGMDYSVATQNRIEMRVLQSVREIHGIVESSGITDSVIDV